jgi:hypothetical protein
MNDHEVPDIENGILHLVCENCKKVPYSMEIENDPEEVEASFNVSTGAATIYCMCRCGREWEERWKRTESTQVNSQKEEQEVLQSK